MRIPRIQVILSHVHQVMAMGMIYSNSTPLNGRLISSGVLVLTDTLTLFRRSLSLSGDHGTPQPSLSEDVT